MGGGRAEESCGRVRNAGGIVSEADRRLALRGDDLSMANDCPTNVQSISPLHNIVTMCEPVRWAAMSGLFLYTVSC